MCVADRYRACLSSGYVHKVCVRWSCVCVKWVVVGCMYARCICACCVWWVPMGVRMCRVCLCKVDMSRVYICWVDVCTGSACEVHMSGGVCVHVCRVVLV